MFTYKPTPDASRHKYCLLVGGPWNEELILHRAEFQDRYALSERRDGKLFLHIYRYSGLGGKEGDDLVYSYVGEQEAETWKPKKT